MQSLGAKVAAFRAAKNLSTKELAKKVGASRQNIENLEADRVAVPRYLCELADAMGVTTDYLLGRTSQPEPVRTGEPQPAYLKPMSLPDALEVVGMALAATPASHITAVADNMAGWARERGADHYRNLLQMLLEGEQRKRSPLGR